MSEIKPCPFCGGADLEIWDESVFCNDCSASGPTDAGEHTPKSLAIRLYNTRPIEDELAASRDRASDACATVQRERDALRDAMQEICCQSNEDWAEARTNPNATLNRIHEIAVDAFYGKSE